MDDLAAEKKRAEVESDEMWRLLNEYMELFLVGDIIRNDLEDAYRDFKLAHNTERGLRHEN